MLAEPLSPGDGGFLKQVMLEIDGATGLGVVGPKAQRCSGSAIVAVEDTEGLPGMLMTAERMVRKLLKSTVAGKPSFLAVGLSCRRNRLRRCIGPPRRFVKPSLPVCDTSSFAESHQEPPARFEKNPAGCSDDQHPS